MSVEEQIIFDKDEAEKLALEEEFFCLEYMEEDIQLPTYPDIILQQNDEAFAISTDNSNPVTCTSISTIATATTQDVQIHINMAPDEKYKIAMSRDINELIPYIEKEVFGKCQDILEIHQNNMNRNIKRSRIFLQHVKYKFAFIIHISFFSSIWLYSFQKKTFVHKCFVIVWKIQ